MVKGKGIWVHNFLHLRFYYQGLKESEKKKKERKKERKKEFESLVNVVEQNTLKKNTQQLVVAYSKT